MLKIDELYNQGNMCDPQIVKEGVQTTEQQTVFKMIKNRYSTWTFYLTHPATTEQPLVLQKERLQRIT